MTNNDTANPTAKLNRKMARAQSRSGSRAIAQAPQQVRCGPCHAAAPEGARQPRQVTARFLSRLGALPLVWSEQRKMLGFGAS